MPQSPSDSRGPDESAQARDWRATLSVQDFGPIARAQIELRPLTLFVGPSNTGKSYMAILAYALHQTLGLRRNDITGLSFPPDSPLVTLLRRNFQKQRPPRETSEALNDMLYDLTDNSEQQRSATLSIPQPAIDYFDKLFDKPQGLADLFAGHLARYFGVTADARALIRAGSNGPLRIAFTSKDNSTDGDESARECSITIGQKRKIGRFRSPSPKQMMIGVDVPEDIQTRAIAQWLDTISSNIPMERTLLLWNIIFMALASIKTALFGSTGNTSYYLPAGRTGLMHAHPAVGSALFDRAADFPPTEVPELPMMSGLLSDFMRNLIPNNRLGSSDDKIIQIAKEIEDTVLAGQVTRQGSPSNYPNFEYKIKQPEISMPIRNASSMVSELAPLVLLLRERVRVGDTLIIEEPESHLHPEAQAAIAVVLGHLVKAGVRVLVTTHSDWLLEQFANLVQIGRAHV